MINNATPYTSFSWTASSCNLWSGTSCGGRSVYSADVPWVNVGTNISMPYCWGGWSTQTEHNTAMANCKSAGDICSAGGGGCSGGGAGLPCASGHDCSGLVSRAWGLSTKYSTSTLPNISTSIALSQTQPGDILNDAGSHTRLIETNYGNGTYQVIEASGADWKTAYHSYTTAQLSGYDPRCYNNVSGGCGTPPPSNDNCSSAITLTPNTTCINTQGDIASATASGLSKLSCDAFTGTPQLFDVWYKFQATSSSHNIIVTPSTSFDAVVGLYTSCSGGQIGCADNGGGTGVTETITATGLSVGTIYYVRVYDYGSVSPATTTFNICITGNGCTPPSSAPTLTYGNSSCPGTSGSATYPPGTPLSWNSVSGATGYQVYVSKYPYGFSCLLSSYNPYSCTTLGTSTTLVLSAALEPGMLYRWNLYATSDCSNSSCDGPISATNYFYVPPSISPSSSQPICSGNGVSFSTTAANVCSGGSVSYQWYMNGSPISGATSTSYYATLGGNYYVQFNFSGSSYCSSASIQSSSVNVSVNPTPGTVNISGSASPCQNSSQNYYASASDATSYPWTIPSGWSIVSGQGTSSITVTAGSSSGNVCATPSNNCGNGNQGCQSVTVNPIPTTATVNGNSSSCLGNTVNYTASASNATSYTWTIPSGWSIVSGQGYPSI